MRRKKNNNLKLQSNLQFLKSSGRINYTQVAQKCGIAPSTLQSWSTGQVPQLDQSEGLLQLCELLGLNLEELLFSELSDNKNNKPSVRSNTFFEGRFQINIQVKRLPDEDK